MDREEAVHGDVRLFGTATPSGKTEMNNIPISLTDPYFGMTTKTTKTVHRHRIVPHWICVMSILAAAIIGTSCAASPVTNRPNNYHETARRYVAYFSQDLNNDNSITSINEISKNAKSGDRRVIWLAKLHVVRNLNKGYVGESC